MDQSVRFELDPGHADGPALVRVVGMLTVRTATEAAARLSEIGAGRSLIVNLDDVARIDTAGAWVLCDAEDAVKASGRTMEVQVANAEVALLFDSVRRAMPVRSASEPAPSGLIAVLETTGRAVHGGVTFLGELAGTLGLFLARLGRSIRHPGSFRLTALVAHAEDVGLRAVPIVALMAFLIGVVLAFQGAAQLQQFGAEVFVVDLIAISILRELGILLTSIIVAGRTASAYTAAIGSMKMREEIDAMRTLGLDPATVLFLPRILALVIMLPVLGLIANVMGLLGGAIMAWIELGISPAMFRTRLVEGTDVSHVIVGLVKAPVFALIIGVVGCHAGMKVEGNAESLGRMTSNAVVTAIFAVIVADALFSLFFARIGI